MFPTTLKKKICFCGILTNADHYQYTCLLRLHNIWLSLSYQFIMNVNDILRGINMRLFPKSCLDKIMVWSPKYLNDLTILLHTWLICFMSIPDMNLKTFPSPQQTFQGLIYKSFHQYIHYQLLQVYLCFSVTLKTISDKSGINLENKNHIFKALVRTRLIKCILCKDHGCPLSLQKLISFKISTDPSYF